MSLNVSVPAYAHIANNTVQSVKTSNGQLLSYFLDNSANTATTYFQFFFLASTAVTLGTTAANFVIPIPGGQGANVSVAISFPALSYAATTTYNGNTAPASACDCTIFYM